MNNSSYRSSETYGGGGGPPSQTQPTSYPAYSPTAPAPPSSIDDRASAYQPSSQQWQGQQTQRGSYPQQQWTPQAYQPSQPQQPSRSPSVTQSAGTANQWQQNPSNPGQQPPAKRRNIDTQSNRSYGTYPPPRNSQSNESASYQQGSSDVHDRAGYGQGPPRPQQATTSYSPSLYPSSIKSDRRMGKTDVKMDLQMGSFHPKSPKNAADPYTPETYSPTHPHINSQASGEPKPKLRPLFEIFAARRDPPQQKCVLCGAGMQVEYTTPHPWAHCSNNSCAYTQNVMKSAAPASDGFSAPPPPQKCTVCFGDIVCDQLVRILEGGSFAHADWSQCEMRSMQSMNQAANAAAATVGFSLVRQTNSSLPRCGICFSGGPADTVIGCGHCVHNACLMVDARRTEATESARRHWNSKVGGNRYISPQPAATAVAAPAEDSYPKPSGSRFGPPSAATAPVGQGVPYNGGDMGSRMMGSRPPVAAVPRGRSQAGYSSAGPMGDGGNWGGGYRGNRELRGADHSSRSHRY